MQEVNITEFRKNLPKYIHALKKGVEIALTSRGHVVARMLPPTNVQKQAKEKLKALRSQARIYDVTSPLDEDWDVLK